MPAGNIDITKGVYRREGMQLEIIEIQKIFIGLFLVETTTSPTRLTFDPRSNWPRGSMVFVFLQWPALF